MKKIFLYLFLFSLSFLASGCSTDYDVPSQKEQMHKEVPAIIESADFQSSVINDSIKEIPKIEQDDGNLSNDNYYINVDGNEVHSPAYSSTVPSDATAICNDGTYSFSQNRRGTCSGHGGVSRWLY